ncbi:ArsR/SmtB family transcription factor [Salinilacihabitans rarus]|uniref:ArsR/SmtB family transcription factor n=1 Tax=Salinilacihabitans rarus TaxID=2961596 RepID=UPI0020C85BE1|nr:metalloregulator ArsR/SmtB family transcription factor [Salinilacihabitans rarus]
MSSNDPVGDACCSLAELHDDVDASVEALADRRPDEEGIDGRRAVFAALANEHRLRALAALREGELCVCELQVVLEAPQSTVATHLRTLREAGLVKTRKKGKWTYYRIADTAALELLDVAAAVDVPTDD